MKEYKDFKKLIKNIDYPIYVAGHENPDHDSICSSLAVARLLEKLGKTVYVLLDKNDSDILEMHNNKYLVVNDVNPEHKDICFVAVDLNGTYRLGKYRRYYENAKNTINIDHHPDNLTNADLIISEINVSSTCEIVYKLIKSYGSEYFDKDIAEYLFTGIMTDTTCFSKRIFRNTFIISQKLINFGIDYEWCIRKAYAHRTMYELKAQAKLINEITFDECLHYIVIDKSLDEFKNLSHNQITKSIAEELRKLENSDTFLIFIVEEDSITVKCKSNYSKNANVIANHFGGGGHKGEAGFTVRNETVESLLTKIKAFIKSL